jgi:hypothetical protein
MPRIKGYEFGRVLVDGEEHPRDVIVQSPSNAPALSTALPLGPDGRVILLARPRAFNEKTDPLL